MVTSAPALPPPATVAIVAEWLASDDFATKFKALEAIIHPAFPVREAAAQLRQLSNSVSHQARQFAAIAMGNGGGADFAEDLARLVGPEQKTIVRIAAAHALFRSKACPPAAWAGLAHMLTLDSEPARRIAQAALEHAAANRFETLSSTVRAMPLASMNLEALSAIAAAAKARPGTSDGIARWLNEVAETRPPIEVRMAIFAAVARMTDGTRGANGLMQVIEEGEAKAQRKLAMATLGSLGEVAAALRERVVRALVNEADPECEALLYRLVVQLRTPPAALPVPFLLQRIGESAALPIVAGACMVLTLGAKNFAAHADVVARRYRGADDALKLPLAICYEKLTGQPIEAPAA